MSTPAIPIPRTEALQRRPKARVDRSGTLVEVWLRAHTALVYLFLFIPIVIVVVYSFNGTDRRVTDWDGLSLRWYEHVLKDRIIQGNLWNSVIVGTSTAFLATTFGTLAALGLQRVPQWVRIPFMALTFVSVIIPEIVIALATLVFFATSFDIVKELTGTQIRLGVPTIIAAHVLFNISLVLLLVQARLSGMDRTHVEASYDLYGTPWRTFWQITFPQLLPAIVAGFLLSFTFSFDDFVITSFVSGPGSTTLPLYVFGQIKTGVTPATNAVAAMMLLITLAVLFGGQLLTRRGVRRGESVATIVAQQP
jgi:spermidine/putrescine transport system permease protein